MKPAVIQYHPSSFASKLLPALLALILSLPCFSQYNVTEIITDYGGYWKSSAASINVIKPDNSHNLLSFSFNGNRYSTGVNDALLLSRGQSFIAGDYRALPVVSTGSTSGSNTKIGLGYLYDGNPNGAGSPAPNHDIPYYLTDGIKGLDLGTCVANLPAGTLNFPVSSILNHSIGDNVPDILITQVADPSGSQDRYEFTDINGAVVGNYVDIVLTNIPPVGNWTVDFYEASQHPMTLTSGFTRTDRPLRLWATDLSSFGITSSNASRVAYFRIILSGNSDVAFVAYNSGAVNMINNLLPIGLTGFSGQATNRQVQLTWETATEINSDEFIIEKSDDGASFTAKARVKAAGNLSTVTHYSYTDQHPSGGNNYYRLKMVDKDGHFEYSKVIILQANVNAPYVISLYPNPATNYLVACHPYAGNHDQLIIMNRQGSILLRQNIIPGSLQTRVDLAGLPAGIYELSWTNGQELSSGKLVIR